MNLRPLTFALGIGAASLYAQELPQALELSLRFYGAQRCGDHHNWTLAPGERCHMGDGQAVGRDLSGGWHDAGDYIKWSRTNAWSAYLLLKSYDAFSAAFQDLDGAEISNQPNGIPDVLDQAKTATDFLLKILSPDQQQLLSRIGGDQDHNFLVTSPQGSKLPIEQGGDPRPVYMGARADVAGISAATLALMARLYQPYDSSYARKCLDMAEKLSLFAQGHRGTTPDNFYPEGDCAGNSWDSKNWDGPRCKGKWTDGDDSDALMCAAVELYRTKGGKEAQEQAQNAISHSQVHYDDPSWMQFSDPCWHSAVQSGLQGALEPWRATARNYLNKVSTLPEVQGLVYFHSWGSLRIASHAGMSLALLSQVDPQGDWAKTAQAQLDFILGKNPYDRSFLTGWGKNPPKHPMHKNAWGLNGDWSQVDRPFELKTPLLGALVGGPKATQAGEFPKGYQDNPKDYVGNEVSIYYNAGLVGLLAWQIVRDKP